MKPIIIIPAYNPDNRLITLVNHLENCGFEHIIVVDDGSKLNKQFIFDVLVKSQCHVIKHPKNQGKGAALKTGMKFALKTFPKSVGVVTADADGQHAPEDITLVAKTLMKRPFDVILGTRDFRGKQVPFKSKWGNRITSVVFKIATGITCSDTQTGLRGIPMFACESLIKTQGERFEYEMNMLLELANSELTFTEVEIKTLYFDDNKGTHFNPVIDSAKIYFNIFKYSIASFSSAIIDLYLFSILYAYGDISGFSATLIARLVSGIYNFSMNKHFVFNSKGKRSLEGIKYSVVFLAQMLLSAGLVDWLISADVNALLSKLFIDSILFIGSYFIQKKFVFRDNTAPHVQE